MCIAVPMPWPPYPATMPKSAPVALGRGRVAVSTACETSVSRLPGTIAAIPASAPPRRRPRAARSAGTSVADAEGDRGVAVPAVEDRAAVDGHQVAVGEHLGRRRDAVHDLVVHRRADRRRVAVVAQERRHGAARRGSPTRRSRRARRCSRPGRGRVATAARVRATSAPAARIASSSAGVLSSMSRPRHRADQRRGPRSRRHRARSSVAVHAVGDLLDRADGVDGLRACRGSTPAAARSRRGRPSSGCG